MMDGGVGLAKWWVVQVVEGRGRGNGGREVGCGRGDTLGCGVVVRVRGGGLVGGLSCA